MNREQAWELLNEYTKNDSLIKHALAVEAALRRVKDRVDIARTKLPDAAEEEIETVSVFHGPTAPATTRSPSWPGRRRISARHLEKQFAYSWGVIVWPPGPPARIVSIRRSSSLMSTLPATRKTRSNGSPLTLIWALPSILRLPAT